MGEAGRPLVVSGEQVRQREFATVRRGYDPDQVRAFLASVADHVDAISRALEDARARVASLEAAAEQATTQEGTPAAGETDPYEQLSRRFAGVLATADNEAERIVDQARTEAERIKLEAQTRAEEVRIRSSQSLIAAQQESDRMLATLADRREAMLRQLHEMQSRLLSVAEDLEVAIQPSDVIEAPASAPEPPAPTPSPAPSPAPASTQGSTPGPTTSSPNAGAMPSTSPAPARAPASTATDAGETAAPVDDLWVTTDRPAPADAGLAGLFDEPSTDDIDLPDLSGIDIDVDDER